MSVLPCLKQKNKKQSPFQSTVLKVSRILIESLFDWLCPALRPGRHHELRGPAGWPGAGNRQGTVQRHQPGHAVGLHRRGGGSPEGRHLPVLAFPCAVREAGRAALQGESGKLGVGVGWGVFSIWGLRCFV